MLTFILLAVGIDHEEVDKAAGWVGIFTSFVAFFLAGAELINDIIGGGTEIIPLGHFDSNRFKFAGYFHVPGRIQHSPSLSCRNVDKAMSLDDGCEDSVNRDA